MQTIQVQAFPEVARPPLPVRKPLFLRVLATLVICLIAAAMAPFALGPVVFVFLMDKPDHAKWQKARQEMVQIHQALTDYRLSNDDYPDALDAVGDKFASGVPNDPFTKQPYQYRKTAAGFELKSLGKDQAEGGAEVPEKDIIFNQEGYRE